MNREKNIKIHPSFEGYKEQTLSFRTGLPSSKDQPYLYADVEGCTALDQFYRDLLKGRSFPSEMLVRDISPVGTVVACALFASPELVFEDGCSSIVQSASLSDSMGQVGAAHVPREHEQLFRSMAPLQSEYKTIRQAHEQLDQAMSLVESYLRQGTLPTVDNLQEHVQPVQTSEKEVVYESSDPSLTWIYRQGWMKGVWLSDSDQDAVVFRKSLCVDLPTEEIGEELNRKEFDSAHPPEQVGWIQSGESGLWLRSPLREGGGHQTSLSRADIMDACEPFFEVIERSE